MLSARNVADYFLAQADPEIGESITNLKLQKLCYYAQGFHLALYGEPLFPETIRAWAHGPVIPSLYRQFKQHGGDVIPQPEELEFAIFDQEVRALLDEVYEVYGQYSAWKLRNMTHEEPPWRDAYTAGADVISQASMQAYFKTLVRDGQEAQG